MSGYLVKVETLTLLGGDPFSRFYAVAASSARRALAIVTQEEELCEETVEIVGTVSDTLIAVLGLSNGTLRNISS